MPSDKAIAVCDRIAEGDSVRVACAGLKLNARSFFRALATDPEVEQCYVRARKFRADARAEEMDDVKRRMTLKKDDPKYIDPNTGRVLMDMIKWQAGKENQGRYGDKLTIEATKPPVQSRDDQLKTLQESGLDLLSIIDVVTNPVADRQITDSEQASDVVEVADV